jgi:hypothetical protein
MAGLAIGVGVILTLLGVIGYFASGGASATALIPAGFGVLFMILGLIARNQARRKHAMHGAAVLALVGLAATFTGALKAFTLMGGGTVERPQAVIAQGVMALLCLVFLIFAIRSFIQARRTPKGASQA